MREVTKLRTVSTAACFRAVIGFLEPLRCFTHATSRSAFAARTPRVLGCPRPDTQNSADAVQRRTETAISPRGANQHSSACACKPTARRNACARCLLGSHGCLAECARGRIVREDVLGFITLPSRRQRNPGFEERRDYHHGWPPSQCFMISVVTVCILYCTEYSIRNLEYLTESCKHGTPRQPCLS